MKNYAHIVNDEQYYFEYKWTLEDFLKRGLRKFLDLEVAKNNYRKKGGHSGKRVIREQTQGRRPWKVIRGDEESGEAGDQNMP